MLTESVQFERQYKKEYNRMKMKIKLMRIYQKVNIAILQFQKEESGTETILKEILTEKFSNLTKRLYLTNTRS